MNKVGMHQFTLARWKGNSYNKGLPNPTVTSYEPGTEALGGGFDGMGAVKDQMIDQGIALCVSTDVEPTCAYFQGPQRVASEHNQITGSDVWGIFDFHLVAIVNNLTGRKWVQIGPERDRISRQINNSDTYLMIRPPKRQGNKKK